MSPAAERHPNGDMCEQWLAHVGETGEDAHRLLRRATSPEASGFAREPLVLPNPSSEDARIIAQILRTQTTPTVAAIATWRAQQTSRPRPALPLTREEINKIGQSIAGRADRYWRQNGCGPTWMELCRAPFDEVPLLDLAAQCDGIDRSTMCALMRPLISRGWVVASSKERSTCAGPSYYASSAGKVRLRNRNQVGELVAHSVGKFRSRHGRRPRWEDLVRETQSENGQRVFRDTADAESQSRWLVCSGWVLVEDDGVIRRGPRARQATEQRRAARLAALTPQSGDLEPGIKIQR